YEKAINEAISRGILADYLTRKGTEVKNMFIGEYDYELDMQVKAEEAREDGIEEGRNEKAIEDASEFLKENISPEIIAKCVKLPLEKIQQLRVQLNR
ncbi:MAG: hypothetical protein K5640_00800, partial [Treponema sp.]|nr:hypothetical protein [Treponema sp.]